MNWQNFHELEEVPLVEKSFLNIHHKNKEKGRLGKAVVRSVSNLLSSTWMAGAYLLFKHQNKLLLFLFWYCGNLFRSFKPNFSTFCYSNKENLVLQWMTNALFTPIFGLLWQKVNSHLFVAHIESIPTTKTVPYIFVYLMKGNNSFKGLHDYSF